jgi:hypothetical protein
LRDQLGKPENCETEEPPFRDIGSGHLVACHYAEKIADSTVAAVVPAAGTLGMAAAEPIDAAPVPAPPAPAPNSTSAGGPA